jgi:putative peptidoglycan lipid II flippase
VGAATESVRPRRGALLVGAGILASRIAGLGRQAVVGAVFGVGAHADVFATALRAPNLLQNLLGEQALSASFIPVYSRLLAEGRREAARRFAGAVFALLVALVAALSLLGVLAARPLVALFAAGYLQDAARVAAGELSVDRFELAVRAVRWIFPMTGLLVLSAWALGVLNSHGRFFLSYVAPVAWNAAIVAALLWASGGSRGFERGANGPGLDRLVIVACVGALAGGLLQFLVQLGPVLRELRGLTLSWRLETEGVRDALRAFGPAVAGRGAVQLSSYLDLFLASLLAAGAVSALGYAQLLYLLPVSLFGQSLAAAALPELSRASASAGRDEVASRSRSALVRGGRLVVPTAVFYLVAGAPLVGALYGLLPGRFGAAEARLVAVVLGAYALGLPAATGARLLQSAFFALGDTRTPARVAAARVAVGGALAVPLMLALDRSSLAALPGGGGGADEALRLGAVGLALAASAAAWLEWGWLAGSLARRLPGAGWAFGDAARVLGASLAGGAVAVLAQMPAAAAGWSAPARLAAALGGFVAGFAAVGLALGLPSPLEVPWIGRLGRGGRR